MARYSSTPMRATSPFAIIPTLSMRLVILAMVQSSCSVGGRPTPTQVYPDEQAFHVNDHSRSRRHERDGKDLGLFKHVESVYVPGRLPEEHAGAVCLGAPRVADLHGPRDDEDVPIAGMQVLQGE